MASIGQVARLFCSFYRLNRCAFHRGRQMCYKSNRMISSTSVLYCSHHSDGEITDHAERDHSSTSSVIKYPQEFFPEAVEVKLEYDISCTLLIKDLAPRVTKEKLQISFPEATDIKMPLQDERHQRYASVVFENAETVEKVMSSKQGSELEGSKLVLEKPVEEDTDCVLLVKNLTASVTQNKLQERFPEATDIKLHVHVKDRWNKGFAFLQFENSEQVKNMMLKQGSDLEGQPMHLVCYTEAVYDEKDPFPIFLEQEVQDLLARIIGIDMNLVFREHFVKRTEKEVTYKLLSTKELQKEQEEALEKAKRRLQVPPFMKRKKRLSPQDQIISNDEGLKGYSNCKYIFTDISRNIPNRERHVVVRDTSGILRWATLEEHARMVQIYLPEKYRHVIAPKMFEEDHLWKPLSDEKYQYILDRACVQFEPDSADFIRVTRHVYQHIIDNKKFDHIRGTRHFGSLAFYSAWVRQIEPLLLYALERDELSKCTDLIHLHCIVNPEVEMKEQIPNIPDDLEILKTFIATDCNLQYKDLLETSVREYEMTHRTRMQQPG